MADIIIEIARFIVIGAIIFFLYTSGKKEHINRHAGWGYIMAGFTILLFGMFVDITDNFPALNRFVVIGDTPYQSFLEKVIGYFLGIILIAIGLWKWVPSIIKVKETESKLQKLYQEMEKLNLELEERVEQRTDELSKANTILKRKMDELKHTEGALSESEKCYRKLINEMLNCFALHEIVYDKTGKPCDYRFLEVNKAFEDITGLKAKDIIGKTVLEVLPKLEQYWIDTYGQVALSGNPISLENYNAEINKHFEVLAYCPKADHFATVFTDITLRKESEERLKRSIFVHPTFAFNI